MQQRLGLKQVLTLSVALNFYAFHMSTALAADVKNPGKSVAKQVVPSTGKQKTPHARTTPLKPSTETLQVSSARVRTHGAEQAITRDTLNKFVSGTSPLQVLGQTTPGVNFGSDDAFGLDTYANALYVRGFNESQIGFTLDGIPLGEQRYQVWNGLSIDQAQIQENISGMTLSQGAGALETPSAQTLGGAIAFTTSNPADKAGGRIGQTFGSYNMFRTFARVDSGVLNSTGTKFYAAYARTAQNLWKGYGDQDDQQVNFKLVQPIKDIGSITAVFDYSNFTQYAYMGLTKSMWEKLGRNTTYLKPNYALAKEYAAGVHSGTIPPGLQGITSSELGDFAYDAARVQRNYLSAVTGNFQIFPNVNMNTVAYAQVSSGNYDGTNPFLTSPTSGVPMALGSGHIGVRRIGFTHGYKIKAGNNLISTGLWYENDSFSYPMRLYEDGIDAAHASKSGLLASQATTWFNDAFSTNTFQFYLQDTYHIRPHMTFTAGFRSLLQDTHGGTSIDNSASLSAWNVYYSHPAEGSMTAANAFLPHFNYDYEFLRHHEIYIDIAENMHAYDYNTQSSSGTAWGALGTSAQSAQTVFNQNKKLLKPERTWNYVIGYRYNSKFLSASADFYHTDYYNRLAAITEGSTGNTYGAFVNVGRETMNGADVQAEIRPVKGLAFMNSFSWNDAQYEDSHLPYGGSTINIKGKHQVYYPKFMYKTNVSYNYKRATFNFNVAYTSSRYMTYTNDQKIPAYWSSNLNVSYDFGKIGFAQNIKSSFGISNLFNKNYLAGVYGAASVSGDNNPNLFVAAPREFFGTISASF
ncbi:TonB-dependent receptor [Gluconacetobacter entanii]|uniref:TonB-dependent receptor n=2 Tax=Gluconacetobacter entanii TaxID=108528 RepID=A0ABT3KAB3_9PROT|nr:TonB-dependent receptor [Gluconacetobacter entanii]MCW4592376.1 TonB-dependent receptor [Gluconacetobacter entanii]MCW4595614.1 TonB-dependent receptor [Gluconacetobacter entanii]